MSTRITELEKLINYHQHLYYNTQPEITDIEFDLLWDELVNLDPFNDVLLNKVGEDESSEWKKAKHIIHMNSQAKASTPEEFEKWHEKQKTEDFVIQHKLDGASLELQYKNGKFTKAVTRGDGKKGDDISKNVKLMKGFINKVRDDEFTGAVRAEVVMKKSIFEEKYSSEMANPRNAANGIMKRIGDNQACKDLSIVCYDVFDINVEFEDEDEKLNWLEDINNFKTVEYWYTKTSANTITKMRNDTHKERPNLPFEIDGLVIKCMEIDLEDQKRARPDKQIAFKFPPEEATTTLIDVEWSESGAHYTPVGIVKPVRLAGTTVQRANLCNTNLINDLGISIGSEVIVVKRGEIIPKIERVVGDNGCKLIEIPTICSTCEEILVDLGTDLICPNMKCDKKYIHRLRKWIKVHDIKDFGGVLINKLYEDGKIKSIADLYSLESESISSLDGMGTGVAKLALGNLGNVSDVSLAGFVAGFDIDGIGQTILEKIITSLQCESLEILQSYDTKTLCSVNGVGTIVAQTLRSGLLELENEMQDVLNTKQIFIKTPVFGGCVSGKTFCFTGTLTSIGRTEAQNKVRDLGGIPKSSVVKGLTYLVTNDPESGSAKNRKAEQMGVKILSEDNFLELINS